MSKRALWNSSVNASDRSLEPRTHPERWNKQSRLVTGLAVYCFLLLERRAKGSIRPLLPQSIVVQRVLTGRFSPFRSFLGYIMGGKLPSMNTEPWCSFGEKISGGGMASCSPQRSMLAFGEEGIILGCG